MLKSVASWLQPRKGVNDLTSVFRTVYGRDPEAEEAATLDAIARAAPPDHRSAFRSVVMGFDHQVSQTAFAVRLTRADVTYLNLDGFTLALDRNDAAVSAAILSGGSYEPHLTSFFKDILRPGMTVIDMGANVGYYSMLAAHLVGDTGKVHSFEPNSENCRLILLSVGRNQFRNVTLHPVALSDCQGHALFTVAIGSNGILSPSTEEELLNPTCVVVPTFRLDDLVRQKVDFIKIDTEGAEGLIVAGAKDLIERDRPVVTSEFSMEMLPRVSGVSGKAYLGYFRELGYELYVLEKGGRRRIDSIDAFLDGYNPVTRIEDLAFIPR